jgi:hypothetical protein
MSTVLRRNRKGTDTEIVRMNAIGLSLATIAQTVSCHPTSVTLRLKSLKIPAADTRRAFMEDIYFSLPAGFKDDLADILLADGTVKPKSIKDYVRELVSKDVAARLAALAPVDSVLLDTSDEPELTDITSPTAAFDVVI